MPRTHQRHKSPVPRTAAGDRLAVTSSLLELPEARDAIARIDRLRPRSPYVVSTGSRIGADTKYVQWELPARLREVLVIQITDVQFGHQRCRYDRLAEYRDWVLAAPNRFMVWTGDMIDAITKLSVGEPWENFGSPLAQVLKFCEVMAPAAHRILGYVGGNHERRSIPTFGDLGTVLAMILKIPYSMGKQLVDLRFGKHQPFKISLWHGMGGARTKGTVAQVLDRFMQHGDSQLYLAGHLHQAMIIPVWKQYRDPDTREIKLQKCLGAMGSSFLQTWNTYAEISGFQDHDVMMPCAHILANGRWHVVLT